MSTHIEVNCFENGNLNYMKRLRTTIEDFFNFNAKNLLDMIDSKSSDTAFYSLIDTEDKSSSLVFLVTKDSDLVKDLNMKEVKESRSLSLFNEEEVNVSKSSFKSLIQTFSVDQTESDFVLENNGEKYSFRVSFGGKANALLSNINRYLDECDMFKEVKKNMDSNPLERIKTIEKQTNHISCSNHNKLKSTI